MLKLLIVDDDDGMRGLMKKRLCTTYEIIETGHPAQAVELALAHRPDAILMDLTMPELDGVEAARQIRARHVLSQTPIFAISGYATREIKADAQAAGCTEVFGKPLDLETLLVRIRDTLGV